MSKMHELGKVVFLGAVSSAFAQTPWYELKSKPGANFYAISQSFQEEQARQAAKPRDLTWLLNDPDLYEQEEDFHFRRWAAYVEPRVAPSGDLALLEIGQQELLQFTGLNGASLPAMQGTWQPLGPFATNTAGAGRLNWIEFHPTDNNIYMVGSASGGLWFTRDAGLTWSTTTDRVAVLGAAWAVYHPSNPNIIYLGTGDGDHSDTKSIGVLKSTDGGQTWSTTGLTFAISGSTQISKLLIDPRDPNTLFVAASNGLHVSTDGAVTFRQVSGITAKVWDVEMHPTNSNIIYASTTGCYRSTDGGNTFSRVTGLTAATYRMQLAVSADAPDYVFALRGSREATEGVHRSVDAGQTFAQTGSGSAIGCTQTWYDYAFDANPVNADELTAGCLRIFRSTDAGANWAQAGTSYHVDIHGTTYRRDGILFTVNDGGIWRSAGGTNWTNLNNNLNIGQSYRMGVFPTDYDRVCTGRQDNGTDIRAGAAGFTRALGADGFECFWNAAGTRFYGESQNGGFQSCAYGNGAVSGCAGIAPSATGIWDTPWAQDPNNANALFAARGAQMFRSTNSGTAWSQMGTISGTSSVRNFTVAPSNSNVLYLARGSDVYKTVDGGGSWQNVRGSITGTPMQCAVSASDPNDVWVAVSGYTATAKVWHSVNGGTSWTNETGTGLPNIPANAVALDNLGQNGVYLGMDAGVFYRRTGFSRWENFSDGLPNAGVRELEIAGKGTNNADRRLAAATFGRGIWSTELWDDTPTGIAAGSPPELRRFSASMSGSVLTLRFQLGTDRIDEGFSDLQLASVNGKVIHREQVKNFGWFEKRIDLSVCGKGIYLFILGHGKNRIAKRLAL